MLIGLIGLKGSGKDTIALSLPSIGYPDIDRNIRTVQNFKFATPLKYIISRVFDIDERDLECQKQKESLTFDNGKTLRNLMQDLGCLVRSYNKNVWIELLKFEMLYSKGDIETDLLVNIVTDVRFDNELEWIKSESGIIIDINRPDLYKREKQIVNLFGVNWLSRSIIYLFGDRFIAHQSEWNYFKLRQKADYQINNIELDSAVKQLEFILDESNEINLPKPKDLKATRLFNNDGKMKNND